jgi:hypothetical protein
MLYAFSHKACGPGPFGCLKKDKINVLQVYSIGAACYAYHIAW